MPEDSKPSITVPTTKVDNHDSIDDGLLKEILLKTKYLTAEEIRKAESFTKSNHVSLFNYLLNQNVLAYELLGQAVAEYYHVPFADLEVYQPTKENIDLIPAEIGQAYRAVVYMTSPSGFIVATDNPINPGLMDALKKVFGINKSIQIYYALPDELNQTMLHYRKPLVTRFSQIIQQQNRVAPEIIDEIIKDATAYKVSDIHLEPEKDIVIIRFRIDGVLHEAGQLPKQYYDNILNRIKVQAHMRIDEHNASQDGAIRYEVDGRPVNVRISVIPTLDGEKIAIRLLAEYARGLNIKSLGLNNVDRELLERQIRRPYGMVITTGPTGSGKTTTLYALMKLINRPEINITTIEDPVEYRLLGVTQIQVNTQTNLDFKEGLRSLVRQDPDVILVGEIRDSETAELAVNAALTGHVLLSTFHANDAASAIPRLLDMGIEPFLLASTLNMVIAQRLVRMIHPKCRFSYDVNMDNLKQMFPLAPVYFKGPVVTLYEGRGCETCNFTGYQGRTAIFEVLTVNTKMKDLIMQNPSAGQVSDLSKGQGDHTLFDDGIDKVQSGVTTLRELLRTAEPK
jgi:type II secretory ATPase GspE/PulE/Tfp pilus assembly ATPase PilB-like protein